MGVMMNQTTLKDIAALLGISTTTVHRALNNKGGISEQLKYKVIKSAEELGYKSNYAASSLKRNPINIAVVLPSQEGSGKFYYKYLWDAISKCQEATNLFNIHLITKSYQDSSADHCRVLTELFETSGFQLDGLLTLPVQVDELTTRTLNKFCFKGIPIVLLDSDVPYTNRLCCVAPHEYNNGTLAAEVLSMITSKKGKVLIAGGSLHNSSHINTIKGFTEYIQMNSIPLEPVIIHGYEDIGYCYNLVDKTLKKEHEIVAFFGGTAREICPLCQAVADNGLAGKVKGVGNDLFNESAQFLRDNVLQAVIDKNNVEKGVLGFNVLVDYIVKKITPKTELLQVPTRLIIKGNLRFYENGL